MLEDRIKSRGISKNPDSKWLHYKLVFVQIKFVQCVSKNEEGRERLEDNQMLSTDQ